MSTPTFIIRQVTVADIKHVYRLLVANRPYVGLNSRYTYFLLARDFSDTCSVAECDGKIVAFCTCYVPPKRKDTLFNWEIVVDETYRGHGLQRRMLLRQILLSEVTYFEATVNPSNAASKCSFHKLAEMLHAGCHEELLFSQADFGNDGHEEEVLYRIGPIKQEEIKKEFSSLADV